MVKVGLIITEGDNEHPCIKQDNGECSHSCPNYCTPDGFTYKEADTLELPTDKATCALGCEGLTLEELP